MKIIVTAALGLAIALTLNACSQKKKLATKLATELAAQAATLTDPRDNKTYKTVKIGEQIWMAENLNYLGERKGCFYEKEANCNIYGRLYDLDDAKKACPKGWHLPSNEEWQTLIDFVGGDKVAGKNLKAKSGWENNGNGTDNFGFSALPGGFGDWGDRYNNDIGPINVGNSGYWWSSNECKCDEYNCCAATRQLDYDNEHVYSTNQNTGSLLSVRCVKD